MGKRIILTGKKVTLRPMTIKDASRFCKWLADLEVTKFLSMHGVPAPSLKEEKEWIKKSQQDKNNFRLAIDTVEGKHIGSTSLINISRKHKNAEFGIVIGDKEYWGQGCGPEVTKLMIDYGFKKLKLHRIYLRHIAYNIRGQKAYQKAGFKIEGRSREHILRDGSWHDEVYMGVLRDEWSKSCNI